MQGMGRASSLSSTRVVVVQKTRGGTEWHGPFYRPGAQARLVVLVACNTWGIASLSVGFTTTVNPINSSRGGGLAFQQYAF